MDERLWWSPVMTLNDLEWSLNDLNDLYKSQWLCSRPRLITSIKFFDFSCYTMCSPHWILRSLNFWISLKWVISTHIKLMLKFYTSQSRQEACGNRAIMQLPSQMFSEGMRKQRNHHHFLNKVKQTRKHEWTSWFNESEFIIYVGKWMHVSMCVAAVCM